MPIYLFRCPGCNNLIERERSKKVAYIRTYCGSKGKGVLAKYVRKSRGPTDRV